MAAGCQQKATFADQSAKGSRARAALFVERAAVVPVFRKSPIFDGGCAGSRVPISPREKMSNDAGSPAANAARGTRPPFRRAGHMMHNGRRNPSHTQGEIRERETPRKEKDA